MTIHRTDDLLLDRQIQEQVIILFERRFGRKYTQFELNSLSRTEQDWIITEAGKEVNRRRGLSWQ